MKKSNLPILAVGAHPDDLEFLCAGTLAKWSDRGDEIVMWQGMSLWVSLRYAPSPWVTNSYIPTLPGKLFFLKELAGPLIAECN